jgi:acyl-coenzyme A synthetase/AMP-(fatty) acid ligase
MVSRHALMMPEKPAIILPDRVVTYDMFAQGMLRVEERLRALALAPGALVCLTIDSPIRQLILGAALFRLGHPVVVSQQPGQVLKLQLPVGVFLHGAAVPLKPGLRQVVVDDAWFAGERRPLTPPFRQVDDDNAICLVALTSGSTGRPKAISLSRDAFQQRVMACYSQIGLGVWERLLLHVGLNSAWGFVMAAHGLFAGRTLLFAGSSREVLRVIGVYNVDALAASSVQLSEIVREQAREPVPAGSLRTIVVGGGLVSRAMIADARARLCSSVAMQYGATETGPSVSAPVDRLTGAEGATGFVAPWAEVEIADEAGNVVPVDAEGVVRIRTSFQGAPYPPGTDNPAFRDGWFYPGDMGRITPEGVLVLRGRTSSIINVGGVKLAPEAIEDVLGRHPAVAAGAAFGSVGDSGMDEISVAVVTSRPVADSDLVAWCARHSMPVTRVFRVSELPKTESGKIDRQLLKQRLLSPDTA